MGVRDQDADWAEHAADRKAVADMLAGRTRAKPYIRAMPGHLDTAATKYRDAAYFLPVTARTKEALGGLVFAKTPQRNLPEGIAAVLTDVTRTGQDIDRFAEQAFDGILETYAIAVLVDYPPAPAGMTVLEIGRASCRERV